MPIIRAAGSIARAYLSQERLFYSGRRNFRKSVSTCSTRMLCFLMDPFSTQVGEKNTQRRSQRVLVGVPVSVVLARPSQKPISEETVTLVLNAHGALVLLAMKLFADDPVTLINPKTGEQQLSRVVYLGPRQADKQEVGIEFVKPSPLFWRIAFPPQDWTPGHEDAKGFAKRVPSPPKGVKNQ